MLVGVMSDSHDNMEKVVEATELFNREGVELVIHLGDIVSPFIVRRLGETLKAKMIIVYGNNDGERLLIREVAAKYGYSVHEPPRAVEIGGRRVLLAHGFGDPDNTSTIVEALAASGKFDAVLYGHTHRTDNRLVNGVLILNPGETYGGLTGKSTVAILDMEDLSASIIQL
jgi:putative phosphoesterase